MRLLNDGVLYEFTVEQANADHGGDSNSSLLRTVMRYRKFQYPHRRAVVVREQSLDLHLNSAVPEMSQILGQFEIPSRIGQQMAEHFGFFADRLARRTGCSEIPVSVSLDVKLLPPETAASMESARAAPAPRRRREEGEVQSAPARRSAVEALERVKVEGERECAVCLEEIGKEATKMPCGHVFHRRCITEWLQRTHFCPFCRYKMPCAP